LEEINGDLLDANFLPWNNFRLARHSGRREIEASWLNPSLGD
jgi:hypothetical protein